MEIDSIRSEINEARYQWIEAWMHENPFYHACDPAFVLPYSRVTGAPYEEIHSARYNCPQLLADLEALYANKRVTRNIIRIMTNDEDISIPSYELEYERSKLYA